MGLIHTPRVLRSIARGWVQRRNRLQSLEGQQRPGAYETEPVARPGDDPRSQSSQLLLPPESGMGPSHGRYTYRARAGIVDYAFGHLNNASYLAHAELARWQMLAYAGLLPHMLQSSTHLVVAGTAIRYKREIKPFRCPFRIESHFGRIDGPRLWAVHHVFLDSPAFDGGKTTSRASNAPPPKSRAQLVVPCAWVRGGKAIDPESYFREAGVDEATIRSLCEDDPGGHEETSSLLKDVTSQYAALEESMRRLDSMRDK